MDALYIVAVIPALLLVGWIIYQSHDWVRLIPSIGVAAVLGIIIAGAALGIELLMMEGFKHIPLNASMNLLVSAFVISALTEETLKFLATSIQYRSQYIRKSYDIIVIAAVVSMTFAIVENILYALFQGGGAVVSRTFSSIPLHCACGVCMGAMFSQAKIKKFYNEGSSTPWIAGALAIPFFLHGAYNAMSMTGNAMSVLTYVLGIGLLAMAFPLTSVSAKRSLPVCEEEYARAMAKEPAKSTRIPSPSPQTEQASQVRPENAASSRPVQKEPLFTDDDLDLIG